MFLGTSHLFISFARLLPGVLVLIHVSVHFHRLGEENSTSDLCFVSAVSLFYCFDGKNVCNIFDHFTSL